MSWEGGCLCGEVRFRATSAPIDVGYCHCRMCQKLSGAAALPWASFATGQFAYTRDKPAVYRSSANGQREFCNKCGSQIAFRRTDTEETIEINVGTLDDPERVRPESHIFTESRISWFDIDDELPRHAGAGAEIDSS